MTQAPSAKSCAACGREITWRKKWARDWEQVRYCSDACRRAAPGPVDVALEKAFLRLLAALPAGATISPTDAVQAVTDTWSPDTRARTRERARAAARRLAVRGEVEIVQRGRVVPDSSHVTGPFDVRVRRTG